jgi:hypothetical protein
VQTIRSSSARPKLYGADLSALPWAVPMSDKPEQPEPDTERDEDRPMQETETGYRIPVPSRDDFFGNLDKISKPER